MTERTDGPNPWESERRRLVADEVRAWMGRRRMNQTMVAARMDRSEMYLSRRLNGFLAFSTDDLFRLADLLDVPADVFLHVSRGGDAPAARVPLRVTRTVPATRPGAGRETRKSLLPGFRDTSGPTGLAA